MNSRAILFSSFVVFAFPGLSQTTLREKLEEAYDRGHSVGYKKGKTIGFAAGKADCRGGSESLRACDLATVLGENRSARILIGGSSSGTDPKTGRQTSYRVPWLTINDQLIESDLVSDSTLETLKNGETVRVAGFEFEDEHPTSAQGTLSLDKYTATLTLLPDETGSSLEPPSERVTSDIREAKHLRMSHGFVIERILDD